MNAEYVRYIEWQPSGSLDKVNFDNWAGTHFDFKEAMKCDAYELLNRLDDVIDEHSEFLSEFSDEEREQGKIYSDFQGGLFWIYEKRLAFKELREASKMSLSEFSLYFNIPLRSVQHWELGDRSCPEYLMQLMLYKLKNENIVK